MTKRLSQKLKKKKVNQRPDTSRLDTSLSFLDRIRGWKTLSQLRALPAGRLRKMYNRKVDPKLSFLYETPYDGKLKNDLNLVDKIVPENYSLVDLRNQTKDILDGKITGLTEKPDVAKFVELCKQRVEKRKAEEAEENGTSTH